RPGGTHRGWARRDGSSAKAAAGGAGPRDRTRAVATAPARARSDAGAGSGSAATAIAAAGHEPGRRSVEPGGAKPDRGARPRPEHDRGFGPWRPAPDERRP